MLAISGPSMLIAWLKLRQRNIGPILDANGWAVNAHGAHQRPLRRRAHRLADAAAGRVALAAGSVRREEAALELYVFLAFVVLLAGVVVLREARRLPAREGPRRDGASSHAEPAAVTPEKK